MNSTQESQSYSVEEVEQIANQFQEAKHKYEQQISLLEHQNSQQKAQIQTLLSDKQKLSEQVQKLMLQIQELRSSNQELQLSNQKLQSQVQKLTAKNESLQNSDKQLSEANRKLKDAEQKKKEGEESLREARGIYRASNQQQAQLLVDKAKLLESIDKSAEAKAKRMVKLIRKKYQDKQRRVNNFAVAAISILMIFSMCVTGIWISDHTRVFVGQTGVVNFFISIGDGIVSVLSGIEYLLDNAVEALQGSTGDFTARAIVYTSFAVLGLTGAFLGIWKGIPKLKEKFRVIMDTYERNGVVGYKKAMTVSLCVIALCFAILLAEYVMVNVIGVWLLMSIGFNLTYHLATYER